MDATAGEAGNGRSLATLSVRAKTPPAQMTLTFIANPRLEAATLFMALARAVKKPSLA